MRAITLAALAALVALPALPAGAQALVHRYSFNGTANDSVGTANGTVVGNVTLSSQMGVNGAATFAGDRSSANPGYISLPPSVVSGLQNATVEIFTTNFNLPPDGRNWEAVFSVGTPYGNRTNYIILVANRGDIGLGTGARTNNGAETVIKAHDPLPVMRQNHVVHLVFSNFKGLGSTGTETIYLDGQQVAQGPTKFSFANVAAGSGGIGTVGIGGGSPWDDPTFSGSMSEVRIYNASLSPAQIQADVDAGPADLGFTLPLKADRPTATVSANQANVDWTSSNVTDTVVDYGLASSYGSTTTGVGGALTHTATLSGLAPSTLYHYRVRSRDIFGQTTTTNDAVFTTAPAGRAQIAVTGMTTARTGTGQIMVTVKLSNVGTADALNTRLTAAKLGAALPLSVLPVTVGTGTLVKGGTATATLNFDTQPAGATVIFTLNGSYAGRLGQCRKQDESPLRLGPLEIASNACEAAVTQTAAPWPLERVR